jgi:hypothetical protein
MQIATQGHEGARDRLYKAGVAHERWEVGTQVLLDVVGVVMFEGPVVTVVKIDENRHDLTKGQDHS